MIANKRTQNAIKWKTRKKKWPIQVFIASSTGLLGSILSSVTEWESIDVSNFFNLEVGTYLVLLFWLVIMGVVAPGLWLLCKAKVNSVLNKISGDANDQGKGQ